MYWIEKSISLVFLLIAARLITKKHYGCAVVAVGLFLLMLV